MRLQSENRKFDLEYTRAPLCRGVFLDTADLFALRQSVLVGILSSVASYQVAEESQADLKHSVQVIERSETVIGN
jgi:Zn-finger nucleic acid-binding protein